MDTDEHPDAESSRSVSLEDTQETQFIPRSDDDETLWQVEAVLAEKGSLYLIKWAGKDSYGKPWENSWVPKHDVTDDCIQEWKAKKAKNQQRRKSRLCEFTFPIFMTSSRNPSTLLLPHYY